MALLNITANFTAGGTLTTAPNSPALRIPNSAHLIGLVNFTRSVNIAFPLQPTKMVGAGALGAQVISNSIRLALAAKTNLFAFERMRKAVNVRFSASGSLAVNVSTNAPRVSLAPRATLTVSARMVKAIRTSLHAVAQSYIYFNDVPISAALAGGFLASVDEDGLLLTSDAIWPDINITAGQDLVALWNPTGLEKTLANIEGTRLTAIYAELVRDQWDPWNISRTNLPYLAWAKGVNLWEDDWDLSFRRWWTANQWTLKYQRGSLLGAANFLAAVNAELRKAWVPPSAFYPGTALTPAEYQEFLAKYPQLRLFSYAPRPALPFLCFIGNLADGNGNPLPNGNGDFFGDAGLFAPTNADEGGKFLQIGELVQPDGTIIELTVQDYVTVDPETDKVTIYSQIVLPAQIGTIYYADEPRYLTPQYLGGDTAEENRVGIFLGTKHATEDMLVNVPKIADMAVDEAKLTYETILPGLDPIIAKPRFVAEIAPIRFGEFYCGQPLTNVFLPPSIAWQYLYQLWYLFDPNVIPDFHQASTFLDNCRLGQPPYTAELLVAAFEHWPPAYIYCDGFLNGYFSPPNRKTIDKLCRATRAGQALRDTIYLDTEAIRMLHLGDAITADGTYAVADMIDA